ncbi:MAG: AAA family ATPase [Proteobacteria bacterium]|nr:AAA family ATPase [Pseudomonadota bacterium]
MLCPRCQTAIVQGARFCARCGTTLVPQAASPAERRQLTVLFCDLVDSTALSVRLDPEDLREVMRAYQKFVNDVVARFGGFVAQYTGDGAVVYFGWPQANEHDAERAVRTGLALVDGVASHAWPLGVELAVRVGIATGLVLVESRDIAGDTPNLAARLQAQAEPNTVVIAQATLSLVRGLFEYRDLGARSLKGFGEAVPAWQVLRESKAASRFDALRGRNLGALIGREEELDLLQAHWQAARKGAGRVVLLTGEAGIGKSRLTRALLENVEREPHRRLRYFCLPHHSESTLHPVIRQMERAAGFERGDDPAIRLDKLEAMLTYLATPPQDAALIADLLSIEGSGSRWPPPDLAPPQRKQRTLDALRRSIEAQASRLPILAVFEDVHWIDPTSLELLDRTIVALQRLPVLLVVTARPGFEAPWAHRPHASEVALNRLRRAAAAELIRQIGRDLSDAMVREIRDQTDGVPLFIEELTRAVVEGGREDLAGGIPTTLQASLMSRLDRLGPARELAQLASVIGRRFSWALLDAIAQRSEAEVAAGLGQLVDAGLIFPEGSGPYRTYRFKHALVQNTAYESLLRSVRQQLHARVAAVLEDRFPGTLSEQVAEHWAQAGEPARAAAFWQDAGEQAIRRGANREAIALLTKGIDALTRSPESPGRDRTEVALQLSLAEALIADRGWTAAETQPCWTRARELCERSGETAALFPVLFGQFSTSLSRGAPDMHDLAQQALQLTQGGGDAGLSAVAHAMAGMSHFARGRFWVARVELEVALSLSGVAGRTSTFLAADHNIAIASLWLAMTLLLLEQPRAAAERAAIGLAAARRLDNPHTLAHAMALYCRYLSILGDVRALRRAADDLAVLAAEHRFPFYAAAADIYRGWVLAERDTPRGLRMLRDGTDAFAALGATGLRPWFLGRMAMLSAALGETRAGIELLDEALAEIERSGHRWCQGELWRLKIELRARASCKAA